MYNLLILSTGVQMYTKKIVFKKFVQSVGKWVDQSLRVTDDSVWHHLQLLQLRKDVKEVVVVDNA